MEIAYIILAIVLSIAISLGVGSSTFAIINFFVAISDGQIDPTERRMMGIVYIVLRVAMVAIAVTALLLGVLQYQNTGSAYFVPYTYALWTLISVLYINAILMTAHIMPSTFGPGIQAATWYSLGILSALAGLGMYSYSYISFMLGYVCMIILAVGIVNGIMAYQRQKREASAPQH